MLQALLSSPHLTKALLGDDPPNRAARGKRVPGLDDVDLAPDRMGLGTPPAPGTSGGPVVPVLPGETAALAARDALAPLADAAPVYDTGAAPTNADATGYQPYSVAPMGGAVEAWRQRRPEMDKEAYGKAKRATLISALLGGGAMLLGGPEGGTLSAVGALASGAAQGFGAEVQGMEATYANELAGWEKGLQSLMEQDGKQVWEAQKINAEETNRARRETFDRLGEVEDRDVREAGAWGRAELSEQGRERRHRMDLIEESAGDALKVGDVDGYVSLMSEVGIDPDVARSVAEQAASELRQARTERERKLALENARVRISQQNANTSYYNAQTSRMRATRPTASRAGSSRASGGETPEQWLYKERNRLFRQYNDGSLTEGEYREQLGRAEAEVERRENGGYTDAESAPFRQDPSAGPTYGEMMEARAMLQEGDPDMTPEILRQMEAEFARSPNSRNPRPLNAR